MTRFSRLVRWWQTLGRARNRPLCGSFWGLEKLQVANLATFHVNSTFGLRIVPGQGNVVPSQLFRSRTVTKRADSFDNTVLEVRGSHLLIRDREKGSVLKVPCYWLRHNCRCPSCFSAENIQILHNIVDLDLDITATDVQSDSSNITVTFSDSHKSVFSHAWLQRYAPGVDRPSHSGQDVDTSKTLWQGSRLNMPSFNFSDIIDDNSTLKKVLLTLHEYGVALIEGVEPSEEGHANVGKFVLGELQSTFFGGEITKSSNDVEVSNLEITDVSYTNVRIPLHTDTSYFSPPCRGMTLQITEKSGEGGDTIISDGFYSIKRLQLNHPEYFRILCDTYLLLCYRDETRDVRNSEPTITINPCTKQIERICFNPSRASVTNVSNERMLDFYRAYQALAKEIYDEDNAFKILLRPDQLLILDNWRVLHARESFTGRRVLLLSYPSREAWMSQMRKIGGLDV